MGIDRAEQLKRWIETRRRVLAETRKEEIARLCLLWIARDQAELDAIEASRFDRREGVGSRSTVGE